MKLKSILVLFALSLFLPISVHADSFSTPAQTIAGVSQSAAIAVGNNNICTADISGSWVQTLSFFIVGSNGSAVPVNVYNAQNTSQGVSVTVNGVYRWSAQGAAECLVTSTAYTSGSASVGMALSTGIIGTPAVIPVNVQNSPAPMASPGNNLAVQRVFLGTGGTPYLDTLPDTYKDTHIITATTTVLFSWAAGTAPNIVNGYLDMLAIQASGTLNTGAVTFEYGYQTTNGCDTSTVVLPPDFAPNVSATGNTWIVSIGSQPLGSASGANSPPLPWPLAFPIPGISGRTMQVCIITTGTVNIYAFYKYATHVN